MDKISRRKFIEKSLLLNGSVVLGSAWICPFLESFALPQPILYHVQIQDDNPAIAWSQDKCKGCRDCLTVCTEKQLVQGSYKAVRGHHVCIHCGACIQVCPYGALTEKYNYQDVFRALEDPSKVVIASIAPSVPAGIGEYFGMPSGSYLSDNIVGACKTLGFNYVLNNNFSADLTIMEEAHELQKRIEENAAFPQFTSCCPAWVKYVEMYYPSLVSHLSTTRSPFSMQGALVKTYFAKKKKIDPASIVHVAIGPCTAKKYEVGREELTTGGLRSTDVEITTNELAMMLREKNIHIVGQKGRFDSLMGKASGGGIIFGNSGGVMRAALRTAHYNLTGKNPSGDFLELKELQGLNGLKEAAVKIGDRSLNVAVVYEMKNAKPILEQLKAGTCKYDFVEVMACQGGCIGGAGQPPKTVADLENRMKALNSADAGSAIRFCHENPEIKTIYKKFLGKPGGKESEHLLHTSFTDKSELLVPVKSRKPVKVS